MTPTENFPPPTSPEKFRSLLPLAVGMKDKQDKHPGDMGGVPVTLQVQITLTTNAWLDAQRWASEGDTSLDSAITLMADRALAMWRDGKIEVDH